MEEKDYLYHGSPVKVDKLLPNQAYDMEYAEGCQYAVYATSDKMMAILFALGCVSDSEDSERIMMPEYGNKMFFKNCHPNYNKKGYVYVLDKSKFIHAMGTQWVCDEEVIPISIEEINVNDYLEYCIIHSY